MCSMLNGDDVFETPLQLPVDDRSGRLLLEQITMALAFVLIAQPT